VRPHRIDVRFIAATNRDLEAEVARGAFRADLYYRLNGITLTIPPLRVRLEEIRPLAETFARQICRDLGRQPPLLPPASVAHLEAYAWPGNIRELKNVIERAVLLCEGPILEPRHMPLERPLTESQKISTSGAAAAPAGANNERDRIIEALAACAGNQSRAAKMLGIPRRTFVSKLDAYKIPRPKKDA
jgi:DNA-binding NtrC family response regulator